MPSETSKYRHLTTPYCIGNGVDIGSGGDPVVAHAIQVELPKKEYSHYRMGDVHGVPIQWHGDCFDLPFKNNVLDFVYSSHLIEDFSRERWIPLFTEWVRVLKPGGKLVVLVPEYTRWRYAIEVLGQRPNCSHWNPEPSLGDLTNAFEKLNLRCIKERLTECHENDYTIIGTAAKPA